MNTLREIKIGDTFVTLLGQSPADNYCVLYYNHLLFVSIWESEIKQNHLKYDDESNSSSLPYFAKPIDKSHQKTT